MEHFFMVYERMVKEGWLDNILIGKLEDGQTYYCAIFANRMGLSPYRFAKGTSPGKAFAKAFNSIVSMDSFLAKRKPHDDLI